MKTNVLTYATFMQMNAMSFMERNIIITLSKNGANLRFMSGLFGVVQVPEEDVVEVLFHSTENPTEIQKVTFDLNEVSLLQQISNLKSREGYFVSCAASSMFLQKLSV